MSVDLILRPAPETTLGDLFEKMDSRSVVSSGLTGNLSVDLTDKNQIVLRTFDDDAVESPATPEGLEAVCLWVGAPWSFVKGMDPDLAETVLNTMAVRQGSSWVAVRHSGEGVQQLFDPAMTPIDPRRYVEVAQRVVTEDAPVDRWMSTNREFLLDVLVPESFDRGVGGDAKVGDLTRGGLRFTQNRSKNMAPQVAPYLYRLLCTNGMELSEDLGRIDSRKSSYEDAIMQLEEMANVGISRLDHYIEQFYALRDVKVDNPERWIQRFGAEQGLSNRIVERLTVGAPGLGDDVTEFDLVNAVTNLANDPDVSFGVARSLQQAGSVAVSAHSARCDHCRSKLL